MPVRALLHTSAAVLSVLFLVVAGASYGDDDSGDEESKFDSRERLERTVLLQDRQDFADAKESLETAQDLLKRAEDAGADQEIIDRLEGEVDRRQGAFDDERLALGEETERVRELIDDLSDDQVFAYNRALNNTISNKLVWHLDDDTLKRSLGADLDSHQINALTQALEQEARFDLKADHFRDLADETGKDHFYAQARRAATKADSQRKKFLDKVRDEHTVTLPEDEVTLPKGEARELSRNVARNEARQMARSMARTEAKANHGKAYAKGKKAH